MASGKSSGGSSSCDWKPANDLFKEGCNVNHAPCLRRSRLQRASAMYQQALQNAIGKKPDLARIQRNLGLTHSRLAELVREDTEKDPLIFHITQSCRHFLAALSYGAHSQPEDWLSGGQTVLTRHITSAVEIFQNWGPASKRSSMRKLSAVLSEASGLCEGASLCKFKLAKQLFQEGIQFLEAEGFDRMDAATRCASLMNEAYQLSVEAAQRGTPEQRYEVEGFVEEIHLYQCTCQSIQASSQGNALLASLLNSQEHLDMDYVWLAIDKYKEAAVLARERDLEAEGSALSRLGHVYKRVLKMEQTAHHYYFTATELALSFAPGRVGKMDWAQEAIREVGLYQEKVKLEEAAKESQEREPYLEMMKDEIAALQRAAAGTAQQLLTHVYLKHAPKNPDHKLVPPSTDPDVTKKALLRAISHYHTDKNLVATYGMQWHVLCGEIVRVLNSKYTYFK